jgi:hypothetical protein
MLSLYPLGCLLLGANQFLYGNTILVRVLCNQSMSIYHLPSIKKYFLIIRIPKYAFGISKNIRLNLCMGNFLLFIIGFIQADTTFRIYNEFRFNLYIGNFVSLMSDILQDTSCVICKNLRDEMHPESMSITYKISLTHTNITIMAHQRTCLSMFLLSNKKNCSLRIKIEEFNYYIIFEFRWAMLAVFFYRFNKSLLTKFTNFIKN